MVSPVDESMASYQSLFERFTRSLDELNTTAQLLSQRHVSQLAALGLACETSNDESCYCDSSNSVKSAPSSIPTSLWLPKKITSSNKPLHPEKPSMLSADYAPSFVRVPDLPDDCLFNEEDNSKPDFLDLDPDENSPRLGSMDPKTWQATFDQHALWPTWREDDISRLTHNISIPRRRHSASLQSHLRAGDEIRDPGCCVQLVIVRPSSGRRVVWDLISIIILAYDIWTLPLQAFSLEETDVSRAIGLFALVFWSFDVFASLTTGFPSNGFLEMRLRKIAVRYLRSWFPLDLVLVSLDWYLESARYSGTGAEYLTFGRTGKALRLGRVLRMFRLLRAPKVVASVREYFAFLFSDAVITGLGIVKLIAMVVLVNHFLACGWYTMGAIRADQQNTWLAKLGSIGNADTSFAWLYTSSLHWSITQFTPASMEVVPMNAAERIYAICVIIFALVAFSSFISSITSAMTHIRTLNHEHSVQRDKVHRYLTENQVSLELATRIQQFLKRQRWVQLKTMRIHEVDVPSLHKLPENLGVQLHAQIFQPILSPHPLFHHIEEVDKEGLLNICHNAMAERNLPWSHQLFRAGDRATSMWFVRGGQADYHSAPHRPTSDIDVGACVCEMVLWVRWEHCGRLVARDTCEFVELISEKFQSIAYKMLALPLCRSYAAMYAQHLYESLEEASPSDLWGSFDMAQTLAQKAFERNGCHELIRPTSPMRDLKRGKYLNSRSRTSEFYQSREHPVKSLLKRLTGRAMLRTSRSALVAS